MVCACSRACVCVCVLFHEQDVILKKCMLLNCSSLSNWFSHTMQNFFSFYFHLFLTLLLLCSSLLTQLSQSGCDGMLFGGCLNGVRMHLVMDLPALWDSLYQENICHLLSANMERQCILGDALIQLCCCAEV